VRSPKTLSLGEPLKTKTRELSSPTSPTRWQEHRQVWDLVRTADAAALDSAFASAVLRLTRAGTTMKDVSAALKSASLGADQEKIAVADLHRALLLCAEGMTKLEAATMVMFIVSEVLDGPGEIQSLCFDRVRSVPREDVGEVLRNSTLRCRRSVDRLLKELGPAWPVLVGDLEELSTASSSLRRPALSSLLRGRGLVVQADVLAEVFASMSWQGSGPSGLPVASFASLLEERARCKHQDESDGGDVGPLDSVVARLQDISDSRPVSMLLKPFANVGGVIDRVALARAIQALFARAPAKASSTPALTFDDIIRVSRAMIEQVGETGDSVPVTILGAWVDKQIEQLRSVRGQDRRAEQARSFANQYDLMSIVHDGPPLTVKSMTLPNDQFSAAAVDGAPLTIKTRALPGDQGTRSPNSAQALQWKLTGSPQHRSARGSPRDGHPVDSDRLWGKLFEAILVAGIVSEQAFSTLDPDKDGLVSLIDATSTLRKLGLPFSDAEASLAFSVANRGELLDSSSFLERYYAWLKACSEAADPL